MARVKRWFPLSHDFLDDPETHLMVNKFGWRSLRVWLRILSIADRNDGKLKGSISEWSLILLRDYSEGNQRWIRRDSDRLLSLLLWMSERGWIGIREGSEPSLETLNHAKFHVVRDDNKIPTGIQTASPPTRPTRPTRPIKTVLLPDWLDQSLWESFKNHRTALKSRMTNHAEELAIKKLEEFRSSGQNPHDILSQSIQNGWKGLFAVNGLPQQTTITDRIEKAMKRGL